MNKRPEMKSGGRSTWKRTGSNRYNPQQSEPTTAKKAGIRKTRRSSGSQTDKFGRGSDGTPQHDFIRGSHGSQDRHKQYSLSSPSGAAFSGSSGLPSSTSLTATGLPTNSLPISTCSTARSCAMAALDHKYL